MINQTNDAVRSFITIRTTFSVPFSVCESGADGAICNRGDCDVDSFGRVNRRLKPQTSGFLVGMFIPRGGETATQYTKLGDQCASDDGRWWCDLLAFRVAAHKTER